MGIDAGRYLVEMERLVDAAYVAFQGIPESPVVFTISIWTDPDAAVSVVSFDTLENS